MKIIVSTCDKYDHLMPGFAWCFNKYWPGQTVDVVGYRQPPVLPDNFCFHSLNPIDDRPFTYYLRPFIASLPQEYFVFLFDDYWMLEPIAPILVSVMEQEVKLGADKGDLSTNTNHFPNGLYKSMGPGNPKLVEATQTAPYRTSTQPCVWTRKYMLKLMQPYGMTPWEFELQGTANNDGGIIVGTEMQIYKYANVYLKGKPDDYHISRISPADREQLRLLGYRDIEKGQLNYEACKACPTTS